MNRKKLIVFAILVSVFAVCSLLAVGCGSGSSGGDDDDDDEETVGTVSGVVSYEGDYTLEEIQGKELVVGLISEWPMTGPPQQFIDVPVPDEGFPFSYEVEISYTGPYFLAAFLDMDPMDGVSMNIEIDPLDVPDEGEQKAELIEGDNFRDFVLQDPWDIDFWWQ